MLFSIVPYTCVKAYQDTQGKMSHAVYMKPRAEFSMLILLTRYCEDDESLAFLKVLRDEDKRGLGHVMPSMVDGE